MLFQTWGNDERHQARVEKRSGIIPSVMAIQAIKIVILNNQFIREKGILRKLIVPILFVDNNFQEVIL